MTTRQRFRGITDWFQQNMPVAESELQYQNPYQLLVSVILSAQCTDKRVNMTTPALFDRFPTPQAMADADPEEIYPYIRSISYPNNKAKNLSGMARMLCEEFGGAAPAAPARPQQRKVSDDTLTSPFVEDLSGKMQQEIAQRQAAEASRQAAEAEAARQAAEAANPAAAANEKVGRMSLDELLNDIHNM